jgi:uncharacterized protein (DUF302 family)
MAIVTTSRYAYAETLAHLTATISGAGNTIFATIDQAAAAQQAGLTLRPTTLIVFGNPKAGTALMNAYPLVALDLPLKLVVWEQDAVVSLAYTPAAELATRYGLAGEDAVIAAMDAALTRLANTVAG